MLAEEQEGNVFWQSKGKADVRSWKGWQQPDHVTDMNLCKLQEMVRDREAGCSAVREVEKSWT